MTLTLSFLFHESHPYLSSFFGPKVFRATHRLSTLIANIIMTMRSYHCLNDDLYHRILVSQKCHRLSECTPSSSSSLQQFLFVHYATIIINCTPIKLPFFCESLNNFRPLEFFLCLIKFSSVLMIGGQ